ncbi:MAG: signal peptidase I [Anaerovorax sp.]
MKDNILFRAIINVVMILLLLMAVVMNISVFTNYQSLAVVSGSMEPTLPYGSLIVISPQKEYEVEDIVTFHSTGDGEVKRFTHRIVSINEGLVATKGDANNAIDPSPTSLSRAEGKVVVTIPYIGYLVMFFEKRWVKIAAILLVLLWMAVELELAKRRKKLKNQEGESLMKEGGEHPEEIAPEAEKRKEE